MAILLRLLQVKTVKLCFMRMVKCIQILTASVLISIGLIAMSLTVIAQLMLMKQTMADLFAPLKSTWIAEKLILIPIKLTQRLLNILIRY